MVASQKKDVRAQRTPQSTRRTDLDGLGDRKVLHRDEVLECSVLKELKLTAGEIPRRKAVSDRTTRIGAEHQATVARLQRERK